jgi:hypothetical protein
MNERARDVVLVGSYSVPIPGGEVDLVVNLTFGGCGTTARQCMDEAIARASAAAREQVSKLAPRPGDRFEYTHTGSANDRVVRV